MLEQIILLDNIIEEYAWVDKLLEEKYYIYALTQENIDEFIGAGFNINNLQNNFYYKNNDCESNISNPFCNTDVEQKIYNMQKLENNDTISSTVSSTVSSETSLYYLNDAYDSDEYMEKQNNGFWFR